VKHILCCEDVLLLRRNTAGEFLNDARQQVVDVVCDVRTVCMKRQLVNRKGAERDLITVRLNRDISAHRTHL